MTRNIAHLFNATLSASRPGRVQSGAGFVEGTAPIGSRIPCRRWPMSADDQDYAASVQVIANHAIVVPPDTDIKRDDLLTIDGVVYEARAKLRPSDVIYLKILAEEIQTGT